MYWGIYILSSKVIDVYEGVRDKVVVLINAVFWNEIIYIWNVSEVVNLVVYFWGLNNFKLGDEIIVFVMEYYSNFVFW